MTVAIADIRVRRARFLERWLVVFGICMVVASLATIAYYINTRDEKGVTWGDSIVVQGAHWSLWAALYPFLFLFMRRFPLDPAKGWRSLSAYIVATPIFILTHASIYLALVRGPMRAHFMHMPPITSFSSLLWALCTLDFAYRVMGYSFLLAFSYALDYHQRFKDTELVTSRLETQLARAQLDALKMQLQPHFLFNTLNAISALLHQDPEAADRMIARLGDFLRMTLENDGDHEVPLAQEMMFLNCYLAIEQVRFQDRLTLDVDVPPSALPALVPNLILQPIVENAIRHGIGRVVGAGRIGIAATREDGRLRLCVKDNGPGWSDAVSPGRRAGGVGIANTRQRLSQLYGEAYRFDLSGAPGEGCTVTLEIPFRTQEPCAS
jgi:two-component system LytT family sensor kinase